MTSTPSSACCSRTAACALSPTPSTRARIPCPTRIRPSTSWSSRARSSSRGRVRSATAVPRQSTPQPPVVRYHNILTQCPRLVDTVTPPRLFFTPCPPRLARNARTYEITLANNTKVRRTSSDPGRALLTGFVGVPPPSDDWDKLDINGLRGIRTTAPYFHNNSAATLEEVVDHYIEFFKRVQALLVPGGVVPPILSTDGVHVDRPFTPEERPALLAYLRKL